MKIRNLLVAILAMSGTIVFAQEQRQIKEEGKTVFKPHWFIQAQVGAAHTVGEAKFTDLMSPAAAINIGYKFAPAFGARIGGSGWQAKGGWVTPEQTYQYKYLQGNLDIMADLSTLFCGFNPKRVFNGYLFGGVGLNRGFDNDEANALDTRTNELEYLYQNSSCILRTGTCSRGTTQTGTCCCKRAGTETCSSCGADETEYILCIELCTSAR